MPSCIVGVPGDPADALDRQRGQLSRYEEFGFFERPLLVVINFSVDQRATAE